MISTEPKPMTKKRVLRISGVIALILGLIAAAAGWWLDVSGLSYFGTAALVTGVAWLVSSRFACDEPMRPEARRYMREFFPAIFAYFLILFGGWSHIHDTHSVALKWVIALLPALPVFLILRAMLRSASGQRRAGAADAAAGHRHLGHERGPGQLCRSLPGSR